MTIADNVTFSNISFPKHWSIPNDLTGKILIGGLRGWKDECYYLIDFEERKIHNCIIDVSTYIKDMSNYLQKKIAVSNLPYATPSHNAAVFNFIQPHEGLSLKDGRIIFAMHNASYAREISFNEKHVSQFSDRDFFCPQMMSATNSLDREGNKLFYSITDMDQRLLKYEGRSIDLDTSVFMVDTNWKNPEEILQLKTQEVIHEVKCCPNEQYLILTEFFLVTPKKPPELSESLFTSYDSWSDYKNAGLCTSNLYLIDRLSRSHSSIPINDKTPGHIEFSDEDPDRFYLSSHNLSKAHGKLILHGQGNITVGKINSGALSLSAEYSDSKFYRVTSHKVFKYDYKNYIAVTVYPNRFYILSEPSLELMHDVVLYEHLSIDAGNLHFCNLLPHMPLWIEVSDNGRYVILVSNEYVYIYDIKNKALNCLHGFSFNGDFIGTAHITNLNNFSKCGN